MSHQPLVQIHKHFFPIAINLLNCNSSLLHHFNWFGLAQPVQLLLLKKFFSCDFIFAYSIFNGRQQLIISSSFSRNLYRPSLLFRSLVRLQNRKNIVTLFYTLLHSLLVSGCQALFHTGHYRLQYKHGCLYQK